MDELFTDNSDPSPCLLPPAARLRLLELREHMLVIASMALTDVKKIDSAPVGLNRRQVAEFFRHYALEIQYVLDMATELPRCTESDT